MAVASTEHARQLVTALLDRFEVAGRPTLVPSELSAVVQLLTRVMTDPVQFDAYLHLLESEIRGRTDDVQLRLLTLNAPDIPDERIVQSGFSGLDETVLADLVLSPAALKAVAFALYDDPVLGPPGAWFFARDTFPRLADAAAPRGSFAGRVRRWVVPFALAASVIIGVGLGWFLRGPDDRRYASVGPMGRGTPRGINGDKPPVFEVRNTGPRRLFVTVVGLSPTGPPRVFDRAAKNYLAVEPGASRTVEDFDAELRGATAYLAVVTETPAGEVVRSLLPENARSAQAGELREKLAEGLRGFGHRSPWVDVLTPP